MNSIYSCCERIMVLLMICCCIPNFGNCDHTVNNYVLPNNLTSLKLLGRVNHDIGCSSGFVRFDESCYYFGSLPVPFKRAKSICVEMGATLAKVDTYKKDNFITEHAFKNIKPTYQGAGANTNFGIWIGAELVATGRKGFKWQDGTHVTGARWAAGQPNVWNQPIPSETGVIIYINKQWHDASNTHHFAFVCEKKASSN